MSELADRNSAEHIKTQLNGDGFTEAWISPETDNVVLVRRYDESGHIASYKLTVEHWIEVD